MSFVCPAANPRPTGTTVFCEPLPERCDETVRSQPGQPVCGGLVCAVHGCQRSPWHVPADAELERRHPIAAGR